jgi:hypothetical protein
MPPTGPVVLAGYTKKGTREELIGREDVYMAPSADPQSSGPHAYLKGGLLRVSIWSTCHGGRDGADERKRGLGRNHCGSGRGSTWEGPGAGRP